MIDWTKPLQTRDGKPARLLGLLKGRPILSHIVAVPDETDESRECLCIRCNDGSASLGCTSPHDIINVPPPRKFVRWVNLNESGQCVCHESRKLADEKAGPFRIGCRRIELTEGFDDEIPPA